MEMKDIFVDKNWRWIDHSVTGINMDPLQSFAFDDNFCVSLGEGSSPSVMRAWVHAPTVVLGIQDTRLPNAANGLKYLREQGYEVIVRNSGGLAVVLDEGIYNLSLIFKEERGTSIHAGYEWMWSFMQEVFDDSPGKIDAYEIVGSYCPGSYDLSIDGKKFAGISQRRIRGGVAVQIYLAVTKSGAARAEILRKFYEHAASDQADTKITWPAVVPSVMTSLEELYGTAFSIQDINRRIQQTAERLGAAVYDDQLTEDEQSRFAHFYDRVLARNKKATQPRS
ncbi:lipoate--protein ligase family protein [Marinococcus halotolerans]|uniref:lipoate--protein ligase family protein n=1 Tax=Marinococcus halotolerans TaxID=301092 RepID=UPI0003B5DA3A|nr:lipoate--protein ligase family protein [Marinococcus halotolerans]